MTDWCYYLDHYPLEQHYADCEKYLYHQIDWDAKTKEIDEKGVIYFNISDVISLFPHLELDENYELICYLSSEYHGIFGNIAAIELGADKTPVIDTKYDWLSQLTKGTYFELPETAVFPMEAIYNDGTPEGYFEAVLCELFLSAIPYTYFEQEHWNIIMPSSPTNLDDGWNSLVNILDWRPRAIANSRPNTILVFQRKIENGFGSSSGRDRIYLTQYLTQKNLKHYHQYPPKSTHLKRYRGQIDNDKRYTETRHCCISLKSSVLIAKEKHYTAKDWKISPSKLIEM